jgi:hypothetical protein
MTTRALQEMSLAANLKCAEWQSTMLMEHVSADFVSRGRSSFFCADNATDLTCKVVISKKAIPRFFWKAAALRAITGVHGLCAMIFPFLELLEEAAYKSMMLGDARQRGKCTSAVSRSL